jgi:hypothetical protein
VFVALRRALGLRLELMVLAVAEVVALRYYRVLRDGAGDALTAEVARRVLDDERRHVPFHRVRLAPDWVRLPRPVRILVGGCWSLLLAATATTVALDHGAALRHLGVRRRGFVRDVLAEGRVQLAELGDAARERTG